MSESRRTESCGSSPRLPEDVDFDPLYLRQRDDHQLCYPISTPEGDGLGPLVDEQDLDLPPISSIDQTRRVDETDARIPSVATPRKHQAGVTCGNGDCQPGRDRHPLPRLEDDGHGRPEVHGRIPLVRLSRRG